MSKREAGAAASGALGHLVFYYPEGILVRFSCAGVDSSHGFRMTVRAVADNEPSGKSRVGGGAPSGRGSDASRLLLDNQYTVLSAPSTRQAQATSR